MDPIARVIMAAFGLFVAWALLRAWRSGVIYSRGFGFDVNERLAVHVVIVVMCAAFAAGYWPPQVGEFVIWPPTPPR